MEMTREQERQFDWWYTNFCKENGRFPTCGECLVKREEIRKGTTDK